MGPTVSLQSKVLPLLLVKKGTVSREDIKRAEESAFICIIECDDPDATRFVHPPIMVDIGEQARAALALMRQVVTKTEPESINRTTIIQFFVKALLEGKPPEYVGPVPQVKQAGAAKK